MSVSLSRQTLIAIGQEHGYRGASIYIRHAHIATIIDGLIERRGVRTVLNVGSGLGIMEHFVKNEPVSLLGIDPDPGAVEVARDIARSSGKPYRYEVNAVDTFSSGEKYDLVVASEVIEHLPDDRKALHRFTELLGERGVLLLSVPNRNQLRNRARRLCALSPVRMDRNHLREYSRKEIEDLIAGGGLEILDRSVCVLYFPLENYIKRAIGENSPIRRMILTLCPDTASHFVYVTKPISR